MDNYKNYKEVENNYSYYEYNIDERILRVCKEAEESYLDNQRIVKDIQQQKKYFRRNSESFSENKIEGRKYLKNNFDYSQNFMSDFVDMYEHKHNPQNIINNNSPEVKTNPQNFKDSNLMKRKKDDYPLTKAHKKCVACRLNKNIIKIDESNKNSKNLLFEIDKIILESKKQMKLLNFSFAYNILKSPISQGLSHSDIFYLFGEICRILKKFEESEYYLIETLKFEQHSPYVLFSLGLLYYEDSKFNLSKNFLKHFLEIFNNSTDAHYHISKVYANLGKYLKAIKHVTKAIMLNPKISEYYEYRAAIYDSMGLKIQADKNYKISKEF